jgi:hypothetical protein
MRKSLKKPLVTGVVVKMWLCASVFSQALKTTSASQNIKPKNMCKFRKTLKIGFWKYLNFRLEVVTLC